MKDRQTDRILSAEFLDKLPRLTVTGYDRENILGGIDKWSIIYNKPLIDSPVGLELSYEVYPIHNRRFFRRKKIGLKCQTSLYPIDNSGNDFNHPVFDARIGLVGLYTLLATLNEVGQRLPFRLTHTARASEFTHPFFSRLAEMRIYKFDSFSMHDVICFWNCQYPRREFDVLDRFADPEIIDFLTGRFTHAFSR